MTRMQRLREECRKAGIRPARSIRETEERLNAAAKPGTLRWFRANYVGPMLAQAVRELADNQALRQEMAREIGGSTVTMVTIRKPS